MQENLWDIRKIIGRIIKKKNSDCVYYWVLAFTD